jgi:hypothetical protein
MDQPGPSPLLVSEASAGHVAACSSHSREGHAWDFATRLSNSQFLEFHAQVVVQGMVLEDVTELGVEHLAAAVEIIVPTNPTTSAIPMAKQ